MKEVPRWMVLHRTGQREETSSLEGFSLSPGDWCPQHPQVHGFDIRISEAMWSASGWADSVSSDDSLETGF